MLVVIAIVSVLSALLLPALAKGKLRAKQVNEVNAARQLMLAWQLYAEDNDDAVLPGYTTQVEARDDRGNALGSPIRDRYPWRLAPALGNNFRSIYVNESRRFLEEAESHAHDEYVYRASLYPSLGYNSVFLGGDEEPGPQVLVDRKEGGAEVRAVDLRAPGRGGFCPGPPSAAWHLPRSRVSSRWFPACGRSLFDGRRDGSGNCSRGCARGGRSADGSRRCTPPGPSRA
jgi:type II secretory pathway pseudopilin PulG